MKKGRVAAWLAALTLTSMMATSVAAASPKLAIFPFDMSMPRTEEDFFRGVSGPNPDEQKRLEMAREELTKRLAATGRYEIVDLTPISEEIKAAQPIFECNGCEVDLAVKAKAELVMTSLIDKISETHLSLTVGIVDVAQGKMIDRASVLIQGNTDESWLHGVRWLVRNRLAAKEDAK